MDPGPPEGQWTTRGHPSGGPVSIGNPRPGLGPVGKGKTSWSVDGWRCRWVFLLSSTSPTLHRGLGPRSLTPTRPFPQTFGEESDRRRRGGQTPGSDLLEIQRKVTTTRNGDSDRCTVSDLREKLFTYRSVLVLYHLDIQFPPNLCLAISVTPGTKFV